MNENVDLKVNEFIDAVKQELKSIVEFGYIYYEDENLFRIWHDNANFDDIEFKKIIGKNIKAYLFENDIFNISVAYNRDKDKEINKIYDVVQESRSYLEHLTFKAPIVNQPNNYNIVESEFENINNDFTIYRPKEEMALNANVNTNISKELSEVLAA